MTSDPSSPPAQASDLRSRAEIPDIAPGVFRQRLLIEGFAQAAIDQGVIRDFLLSLAARLQLRTYGEPVIFAPDTGMGKSENAGFDAFVPLIDSGISLYYWAEPRLLSVLLYTCKGFDADAAVRFTASFFGFDGDVVTHSF